MINDVIFWPRFLRTDLVISEAEVARVIREAVRTMLARYATAKWERRVTRAQRGNTVPARSKILSDTPA